MIKHIALWIFVASSFVTWAKESISPTISPWFYTPDSEITVTYDVTGTPLANLTEAFAWVWIPGKNTDSKYNVNPASSDVIKANNVKFTKSASGGKTLFSLTFIPSALFTASIALETEFGILLKGNDWSNGQTTDFIGPFWNGNFQMRLIVPSQLPFFGSQGGSLLIEAETPVTANYNLYVDGALINTQNNTTQYSFTYLLPAASHYAIVKLMATAGTDNAESVFQIVFPGASPSVARPSNIVPGINYHSGDHTKATLSLWAPLKTSVYVVGDFTDWKILPQYLMKKDGEYFWLEVAGLTVGQEYAFQYLVDESVYVADPYADKILDPDDRFIPAEAYPGLKPFPEKAIKEPWYFNRAAVIQTRQQVYDWQTLDFE